MDYATPILQVLGAIVAVLIAVKLIEILLREKE